jgi:hypothetical protein
MTRRSKFSMTAILLALVGTTMLAGDFLMPRWLCRGGEWKGPVSDHFDGVFFYNAEPSTLYKSRCIVNKVSARTVDCRSDEHSGRNL